MRYDWSMIGGTTFALSLIARQRNGTVIDLTGATIDWRFGKRSTKGSLSLTDGISVTDATNGAFTITVAPAKTVDLSEGHYEHQGEVTESSGTVTTVIDGFLEIRRDFT